MRQPTRRNKNAGRTQGGRVRNGRASEKWSRGPTSWDALTGDIRIVRENPSRAFFHPCEERGIRSVLSHLPKKHRRWVGAIVLRRTPAADERRGVEARVRHRTVSLNAFPHTLESVFPTFPGHACFRHHDRWCSRWTVRGRAWVLTWTAAELERYYLYHLLLHEIGHLADPQWRSSRMEREAFAENYALDWARKLRRLPAASAGVPAALRAAHGLAADDDAPETAP